MAKFIDVMKQARRICKTFCRGDWPCADCLLLEESGSCAFNLDETVDFEELESRVIDWAIEHPEPKGLSWEDAWKQLFPNGSAVPCPKRFDEKYANRACGFTLCRECVKRPIPVEAAERLGIKLEGVNHD